jgi:hypothetical protein
MRSPGWGWSVLGWAAALALAGPASASAQGWEIEVHGGRGASSNPVAGSGSLPGTGSASAATVSSWYFGDGALALNQVLAFFGLNEQITALDPTLKGPFIERAAGATFGVRLDRVLTPRFSLEVSVDDWLGPLQATSTSQAALGAASTSFINAWNALLSSPARGTQAVTSAASVNSRGRQFVATGGLVINLSNSSRVMPYATIGAGVVTNYDGFPSAQLIGTYQFAVVPPAGISAPAPATFHETDMVTVSSSASDTVAGMFGAGVRIAGASRWGVRVDARDHLGRDTSSTMVTTAPASQVSQPTGVFVLGTSPPLQFSTVPGAQSTLSSPLSNVTTFRASGIQNQISVTVGLYWRF